MINREKFEVKLDLKSFTDYSSQGLIKFVKTPKIIKSVPLADYYNNNIYENITKNEFEDPEEITDEDLKNKSSNFSFEKLEEAQGKAGFFDENMIWADFEKLNEIRFTEFFQSKLIES